MALHYAGHITCSIPANVQSGIDFNDEGLSSKCGSYFITLRWETNFKRQLKLLVRYEACSLGNTHYEETLNWWRCELFTQGSTHIQTLMLG